MPLNTPKTFCMKIENIVKEKKITHMDASSGIVKKKTRNRSHQSPTLKALREKIEADARDQFFTSSSKIT